MFPFSKKRRDERQAAARLYDTILEAARRPGLYLHHGVPDTLQGRFEMVTLHLFAVLHRLMHVPGDDAELARLVSERFVEDMDSTFREMGVGDLSVPKRMHKLYGSFAGRFDAYEAAITQDGDELAAAIARNVFPDAPEDAHAARLAAVLRETVSHIQATDLAALRRGELSFPALPMPSHA